MKLVKVLQQIQGKKILEIDCFDLESLLQEEGRDFAGYVSIYFDDGSYLHLTTQPLDYGDSSGIAIEFTSKEKREAEEKEAALETEYDSLVEEQEKKHTKCLDLQEQELNS